MSFKSNIFFTVLVFLSIYITGCKEKKDLTQTSNNYINVGEEWVNLSKLKGNDNYKISVKSLSDKYKIGDKISFEIVSQKSGYLYVLHTNKEDQTTLLFPNDASRENNITKGKKFILPRDDTWEIVASPPAGESLITFLISKNKEDGEDLLEKYLSSKSIVSKDLVSRIRDDNFGVANVVLKIEEK